MTREWQEAQEHELAWWASLKDRLESPGFIEQKRLAAQEIWTEILEFLGNGSKRQLSVLEIGTGGDGFVNFIPHALCVGVEPLLPQMKQRGVGLFSSAAHFVCGVGENLPFIDNSFDVVFSYNVLDHTAHPDMGLNEVRRVLKAGGVLHLLVDTYSLAFRFYRRLYKPDPYHPHTFSARQMRRWLRSRGLRIIRDVSDQVPLGRRRHVAVRVFCRLSKQPAS